VTRRELAELGLENLVGSEALKAYMHGYFVDNKLYQRAKAVANPSLYEDYRKQQARKKQQEKQEKRITLNSKRPAVNAELAERRKTWVCPEPKIKSGYLTRYAKLVSSADKGAILQ